MLAMKASQSAENQPLHAPGEPPLACEGSRCVGAFTHRKLWPLPHGAARWPVTL